MKPSAIPEALILTRGNRLTGLLSELEAALREEESSLALWRAEKSLRSLVDVARGCATEIESGSRELERARHTRRPRPFKVRLP